MNIVCLFIILCSIYFIYYNVFEVNVEPLGFMKKKIAARRKEIIKKKGGRPGLNFWNSMRLKKPEKNINSIVSLSVQKKMPDITSIVTSRHKFPSKVRDEDAIAVVQHYYTNQNELSNYCAQGRWGGGDGPPPQAAKISKGGDISEAYIADNGDIGEIKRGGDGKFIAKFTGNSVNKYCELNIMKQIPKYDESTDDFKKLLSQNGWGGSGVTKCDDMKDKIRKEFSEKVDKAQKADRIKCREELESKGLEATEALEEKENELEEKDNKLKEKDKELEQKDKKILGYVDQKKLLDKLKTNWWWSMLT